MASIGILLIALALGYVVCFLANREEKALKGIGYIIGICIIALTSLLIMKQLYFYSIKCGKLQGKGIQMPMPRGMMHPQK